MRNGTGFLGARGMPLPAPWVAQRRANATPEVIEIQDYARADTRSDAESVALTWGSNTPALGWDVTTPQEDGARSALCQQPEIITLDGEDPGEESKYHLLPTP